MLGRKPCGVTGRGRHPAGGRCPPGFKASSPETTSHGGSRRAWSTSSIRRMRTRCDAEGLGASPGSGMQLGQW